MKTSIWISAMLLSVGCYAQVSSSYEGQIQDYGRKIDSVVSLEKGLMLKEIEALEQRKLPPNEERAEKEKLAKKYEQIINQKIEEQRETLEKLTKERVKIAVMKPYTNEPAPKEKIEPKPSRHPLFYLNKKGITVSYSFLNLTQSATSLDPFEDASKMRVGNSHTFEIWARQKRQIGATDSPFFIQYGVAYRSDTYMPKRPLVFAENEEQLSLQSFSLGTLKRSKFRNHYITLPVDFQWVLNPQFRDYEGQRYLDGRKNQFRIGLGLYAGVNVGSIIKVKYDDAVGDYQRDRHKVDYGVNAFLMGGKLSLSYGGFTLFLKKDFTPIFNQNAHLPAKNGIQMGVEIANLSF